MSALTPPEAGLLACVVVPARDEEGLVGACLEALAGQEGVDPASYEVLLVLDACRDATREQALAMAVTHPHLRLRLREGPGSGPGPARRVGMDLACARLLALDRPDGLIASTDADSVVASDWLRAQLDAVERGARAIGGRIELDAAEAAALSPAVLRRRARHAETRRLRVLARPGSGRGEHWQFSGASLGITAETYAGVGGLAPHASALEDEALEHTLGVHGVSIERPLEVRVTTSARLGGRARRGLARDLALSDWLERRTYRGEDYELEDLVATKRDRVSVILPAREVATTIDAILAALAPLRDAGLLDEIVVVDAASRDGTADIAAARGARVVQESSLRPDHGPALGKGDAMWRGLGATSGDVVLFLDADTEDFTAAFALGLLGPLLAHPELQLVKGSFRRPLRLGASVDPTGGGRVTELTARPLLNLFAPELAGFAQPLAGEIAARRSLLEAIPFPVGYGIEIGMLLDAARVAGVDALAQVDLGTRQNRHQPLRELSVMAYAILVTALRRLHGDATMGALAPGPLVLPHDGDLDVRQVSLEERPALAALAASAASGHRAT